MKALTLFEPWASLIAWGYKQVETRSFVTHHRGTIAIHASKSTKSVKDFDYVQLLFRDAGVRMPDWWPQKAKDYPLGKIVAVVHLADCQKMDDKLIGAQTRQEQAFGAWERGRYAWFLPNARRIPSGIPIKGALRLWNLPPEVEAQALARAS